MRIIGNKYLSEEFKRHKEAELYYVGIFMKEWNQYHDQLSKQLLSQEKSNDQIIEVGKKLEENELEGFSDAQIGQLFELRQAAKKEDSVDAHKE